MQAFLDKRDSGHTVYLVMATEFLLSIERQLPALEEVLLSVLLNVLLYFFSFSFFATCFTTMCICSFTIFSLLGGGTFTNVLLIFFNTFTDVLLYVLATFFPCFLANMDRYYEAKEKGKIYAVFYFRKKNFLHTFMM